MSKFKAEHIPDYEVGDDTYPATPIILNVSHKFGEREYENLLDDYMSLTPDEAERMRKALSKALKRRKEWLAANPDALADMKVKAERKAAGYDADGNVTQGWYWGKGWYPDLPEDNEWMLGNEGARYTNNEDPEVRSLLTNS